MKTRSLFDIFDDDEPVIQVDLPSGLKLRPYQVNAVDGVFREWESGSQSTLVVAATGLGKSVIFSEVMRRFIETKED